MTALTHQRIELTDEIVDKWETLYAGKFQVEQRYMRERLVRACARGLSVKKLREWSATLGEDAQAHAH